MKKLLKTRYTLRKIRLYATVEAKTFATLSARCRNRRQNLLGSSLKLSSFLRIDNPTDVYRKRLNYELSVIESMGLLIIFSLSGT